MREDSAIIAAPIRIAESDYVCEVVVTRLEDNRFYLHEVTAQKNLHNDAFITNLAQKPASLGDLAKVLQDIVCASTLPEFFLSKTENRVWKDSNRNGAATSLRPKGAC